MQTGRTLETPRRYRPIGQRLNHLLRLRGKGSFQNAYGWVAINHNDDEWSAMWTTDRDDHFPIPDPSISVTTDARGIVCAHRSTVSMHLMFYREARGDLGSEVAHRAAGAVARHLLQCLTRPKNPAIVRQRAARACAEAVGL